MKGLFQCPPWARSFCPFRACGAKQGVWDKTGRVGQNRACGVKLEENC